MKRKVVKTGSSLAVTLPRAVVDEFDPRCFDDGKVTRRFEELVEKLLDRRKALYRELAR